MSEEKEEHYVVLTWRMALDELLSEAIAAFVEGSGYGYVVRFG